MSDIKISYSGKLIKHIIKNALFLDIFTIKECNDYLRDADYIQVKKDKQHRNKIAVWD